MSNFQRSSTLNPLTIKPAETCNNYKKWNNVSIKSKALVLRKANTEKQNLKKNMVVIET